jgi:tRNA (cytidine/uridine-2'-O-)-methyltransferase
VNVVLVEPEIPPNTGSVSRLCAGTGADLHLVGRLGFSLADRYLKRAGLDYWPAVKLHLWSSLGELREAVGCEARFFFYSSHGRHLYTEARHAPGDYLVFGKESVGLPRELLAAEWDRTFVIPHAPTIRSLNLANAVSIVLYEALRQTGFACVLGCAAIALGAEGPATPLLIASRRAG